MSTTNEEINDYISYFKKELHRIESIESPLFSKILLFSILDTISRPVYPNVKKHREKFLNFIGNFLEWNYSEIVSLQQLYWKLVENPKLITNPLCKELRTRLCELRKSKLSSFTYFVDEIDLPKSDLLALAQEVDEKKFISETTHLKLLYLYRNHLVHEYRKPGYGFETNNSKPYYSTFSSNLELIYPKEFLLNMVKDSIIKLHDHLIQEGINPWNHYNFTSIWKRT